MPSPGAPRSSPPSPWPPCSRGGTLVAQMEVGRARNPADRQQRDAGDRRDQGRCRRQGRRERALSPAGGSPSARASRRCGPRSTSGPISEAPNLSDSTLDGLVSSIVVEREQIGPNRYIADLGILFDRDARRRAARRRRAAARSAPMLLIPVTDHRRDRDQRRAAQSVAARLGAVSAPRKARSTMSGSAGWGSIRCWSTPRRRGARVAAGGATSSTFMARRTSWSPKSACTASIRAGRRAARSSGASVPTATGSAVSS